MTEKEYVKTILPNVEALVRDLETMPASYQSHVIAKQCVEKFWSSIQPKSAPANEAAPIADATSV